MTSRRNGRFITSICVALLLMSVSTTSAQPRLISYQGFVQSGGVPLTGNHTVTINYYDSHGTPIGSETDPTTFTNGVFNYVLGHKISPSGEFPASFTFVQNYTIGVQIDGGAELIPQSSLLSAPYALEADAVNGIHASAVPDSGKLFPLPLTGGKISPSILPDFSPQNSSVGTAQIRNGAVTSAKIANGAVGLAQLDSSVVVNPASPTTWTALQTFQTGVNASTLTLNEGHLISKQITLPTMVVSNSANVTSTFLFNETDMAGRATMTLSAAAGATDYMQVNFIKPFPNPPIIVISPADGVTAPVMSKFYATATTTYFRIYLDSPVTGSFTFYYMVMGTQ